MSLLGEPRMDEARQGVDIPVFGRTGNFYSLMRRINSLFGLLGNFAGAVWNYLGLSMTVRPPSGRNEESSLYFSLIPRERPSRGENAEAKPFVRTAPAPTSSKKAPEGNGR